VLLLPEETAVVGNYKVVGSFGGEPRWQEKTPEVLRALRDWPYSDTGEVDWCGEGGVFYQVFGGDHHPGQPRLVSGPSDERRSEVYRLSLGESEVLSVRKRRVPSSLHQCFCGYEAGDKGLSLGNEGALRHWVNEWGCPVTMILEDTQAEVPKGDYWFPLTLCFCPILKVQYEAFLLRLVLRVSAELSRPSHNQTGLEKDLPLLWLLWQQGVAEKQEHRDYGLRLVSNVFSTRLRRCTPGVWPSREGDPKTLERGFHRTHSAEEADKLRPVGPFGSIIQAVARDHGGLSANFAATTKAGILELPQMILWLQAWTKLLSAPLVRCSWEKDGERCKQEWFAEGRQRRDFYEGKRVWCPLHRNRRPRANPEQDREKARLRMQRSRAAK